MDFGIDEIVKYDFSFKYKFKTKVIAVINIVIGLLTFVADTALLVKFRDGRTTDEIGAILYTFFASFLNILAGSALLHGANRIRIAEIGWSIKCTRWGVRITMVLLFILTLGLITFALNEQNLVQLFLLGLVSGEIALNLIALFFGYKYIEELKRCRSYCTPKSSFPMTMPFEHYSPHRIPNFQWKE